MGWLADHYRRFERLCQRDIWQPMALKDHPVRGRVYGLLRVMSITYTGLFENHITSRAAALSYASLLGLGPLVALAMLVAGFVLNQRDPTAVVNSLNRALEFIAPQVALSERLDRRPGQPAPPAARTSDGPTAPAGAAHAPEVAANPALVQLIDSFVTGSRSGTAGAVGVLTLIFIVIQLFTSVENAFNAVWGVRRGRSWLLRVVFYWTIMTLGAVLFFASLTALSAAAFIDVFFEKLPYGAEFLRALQWMLPALSVGVLVVVLTVFYRYIPNTRVFWWAALIGALVVTGLLFLNNYLAFLYFKRVVLQRSLYGSLGILPILMLGLFIFWFFVLVGGQISYAVQNVHYRSSQAAWQNLSESARESLSLLVLLVISRRFKECQPAYSASELSRLIKVPTQILNESLNRLSDLALVSPIPPAEGQPSLDNRYQPARPLARITLAEFKQLFETHGENPGGEALHALDAVLQFYHERLAARLRDALGTQTLDALLDELPAAPKPVAS
ncbi:MAG TPA: YihY/virulence factor BrkB family protein [Opitutaceae bacterium]|nr:YihY/virulence factor BrkB family protein [Opitutaceae bacterium]